jgi:hypothetical protein
VDPDSREADSSSSYPSTLGYSSITDAAADDDYLVICHSSDSVSKLDIDSGSAVVRDESVGSGADCNDVIFAPGDSVLISANEAGVMRFATEGNGLTLVIDDEDGLEAAMALTVHADEEQLIVADDEREEFVYFSYSSTSGNPGDEESLAVSYPEDAQSGEGVIEISTLEGYSVAVTDLGSLWVLSDRPWVDVDDPSPSSGIEGDEVILEFTADTDGEWTLYLGNPDEGGEEIDTGDVEADESVELSITIDSSYGEGENLLWVVVEDSDGLEGHDATSITVDNPPEKVSLTESSVGFGNQQITVSFEGIDDEDLESYQVYISITDFDPDDYESGGPDFDGWDDIDAPFEISASPGETVIYTISPLTNRRTYYVAVRAVDSSGLEGPMSDVVEAMPLPTVGAAALSGEEGGLCGSPLPASGLLAFFGGLAVALRRRSSSALGLGLGLGLCAGLTAMSSDAMAHETEEDSSKSGSAGSLEFRYGPVWLDDSVIKAVFGETGHEVLWVEVGPHLIDQLDLSLGFGFYQELGFMLADTEDCSSLLGTSGDLEVDAILAACDESSEHDMLTAFPITLDVGLRLDFIEDQLLVPTIGVGGDYWLWRENWYVNPDVGGTDSVTGGKVGWHWTGGLELLLNRLDRQRASALQARSGIDRTWLAVEYRQQGVGDEEGLEFSGSSLTAGLRFDF